MIGSVYFVQEGRDGAIKIGWTRADPEARVRAMQVGNSNHLVLLGAIPAAPDSEIDWHERFAGNHKRNEWFWPTAGLLAAINVAIAETEEPVDLIWDGTPVTASDIYEWVRANGLTMQEFASQLRYSTAHVVMTLDQIAGWGLSPRMAYRIERATGGAFKADALLVPYRKRKQEDADAAAKVLADQRAMSLLNAAKRGLDS